MGLASSTPWLGATGPEGHGTNLSESTIENAYNSQLHYVERNEEIDSFGSGDNSSWGFGYEFFLTSPCLQTEQALSHLFDPGENAGLCQGKLGQD